MNKIIIIVAVLGFTGCAALQNAHQINGIITKVRADIDAGKLDEAEQLCVDGQSKYPDGYDWAAARSTIRQYRDALAKQREALVKQTDQKVLSLASKDIYHVVGCGLIKECDSSSSNDVGYGNDVLLREQGDEVRDAMAKKLQKCGVSEALKICGNWHHDFSDSSSDGWTRFYDGKNHEWKKTETVNDGSVNKRALYYRKKAEDAVRRYAPFFLFCEAYSGASDQGRIFSFISKFMQQHEYREICHDFGADLAIMRRTFRKGLSLLPADDQDGLMLLSTNDFHIGSPFVEAAYTTLSSTNQFMIAKMVAAQKMPFIHSANLTTEDGTLESWYNYAFEKQVLKDWRKELVAEYGCEKSAYPTGSLLQRFSSILYSDEELAAYRAEVVKSRGEFDGLFGRKFGEVWDVRAADYVYVNDWKTAFWRVKFEPEKKSSAFQDYYLWMTLASHKVFAVEARSNKWTPEGFLELLEKRYMLKFTKDRDIAEMVFPVEKCSLKVFGATSDADRTGVAMVTALFAGAMFGDRGVNDVLGEYCEDVEKRKRQRQCYKFGRGGDDFNSLIVAEDVALSALAKKEAEELWERRRKEREQKKRQEAEDAASAF